MPNFNSKLYYENHKEYYQSYRKKYREENLERLKENDKVKMICECGKQICKRTLNKHILTKKHILKIQNL